MPKIRINLYNRSKCSFPIRCRICGRRIFTETNPLMFRGCVVSSHRCTPTSKLIKSELAYHEQQLAERFNKLTLSPPDESKYNAKVDEIITRLSRHSLDANALQPSPNSKENESACQSIEESIRGVEKTFKDLKTDEQK